MAKSHNDGSHKLLIEAYGQVGNAAIGLPFDRFFVITEAFDDEDDIDADALQTLDMVFTSQRAAQTYLATNQEQLIPSEGAHWEVVTLREYQERFAINTLVNNNQ